MDTATAATAALVALVATSTASSGGTFGAALVAFLVLIPLVIKLWNWSKEASAQGELYEYLSEQVKEQRKEFEKIYAERNILGSEVLQLRARVEHLEDVEKTNELLKQKLDYKDQVIAERDSKITLLLNEMLKMKDRIHDLEIRLQADEKKFCDGCVYKSNIEVSNYIESNLQYIPPNLSGEEV